MKCLCVHISVYNLIIKNMIKSVFAGHIVPGTYYNHFSSLSCGLRKKKKKKMWDVKDDSWKCTHVLNPLIQTLHVLSVKKEKEKEY